MFQVAAFCLNLPVKVSNSDNSCISPIWTHLTWGDKKLFWSLADRSWGGREESPLIRKMLLLIRAITQCHNYQCHQLVCNKFFLHPGTDQRPGWDCVSVCVCMEMLPSHAISHAPNYSNWLDMQIGPKLNAACKGTPRGIVLNTHSHTCCVFLQI